LGGFAVKQLNFRRRTVPEAVGPIFSPLREVFERFGNAEMKLVTMYFAIVTSSEPGQVGRRPGTGLGKRKPATLDYSSWVFVSRNHVSQDRGRRRPSQGTFVDQKMGQGDTDHNVSDAPSARFHGHHHAAYFYRAIIGGAADIGHRQYLVFIGDGAPKTPVEGEVVEFPLFAGEKGIVRSGEARVPRVGATYLRGVHNPDFGRHATPTGFRRIARR
jgi:hypothetical protein